LPGAIAYLKVEVNVSKRFNLILVVLAVMMAMLAATPGASGATAAKAAAKAGLCYSQVPTINGTSAGETINGTPGNDVIRAGGGNDTVNGLGGDDRICGNGGDDTLFGNDGNDKLKGGTGNDTLDGHPGIDVDQAGKGSGDSCANADDSFGGCESFFGPPETTTDTLDFTLPAGQDVTLVQNFPTPDPRTFNITSGGGISTAYLNTDPQHNSGDCTGFAVKAPDLQLTYNAGTPQPFLRFFWHANTAGIDGVLIINAPNGQWFCNDDFAGLNPQITFNAPSTGTYDVYVASRGSGGGGSGVLSITELNINVTP